MSPCFRLLAFITVPRAVRLRVRSEAFCSALSLVFTIVFCSLPHATRGNSLFEICNSDFTLRCSSFSLERIFAGAFPDFFRESLLFGETRRQSVPRPSCLFTCFSFILFASSSLLTSVLCKCMPFTKFKT